MGYDDHTTTQADRMRSRENRLLEAFGIGPGLRRPLMRTAAPLSRFSPLGAARRERCLVTRAFSLETRLQLRRLGKGCQRRGGQYHHRQGPGNVRHRCKAQTERRAPEGTRRSGETEVQVRRSRRLDPTRASNVYDATYPM